MKNNKEQLIFLKLMQPFIEQGCKIKFNPTRIIMPNGSELYNEKNYDLH